MKYKIITLMISMIFLLGIMPLVSAEIYLWQDVILSRSANTTTDHIYIQLDDTSEGFKWRNRQVPITLKFFTQDLPFNLTFGQVTSCNFSYTTFQNTYDNEGNFLSDTKVSDSFFFTSGINEGEVTLFLKDDDDITADFKCFYTNTDSLYEDNALIGRITTFLPSFECRGCTEFTLEELSNEVERSEEITVNELAVYRIIQEIINKNFQLWLIASWIVKLFLVIFAVGLIFASFYYMWKFFEDIADRI